MYVEINRSLNTTTIVIKNSVDIAFCYKQLVYAPIKYESIRPFIPPRKPIMKIKRDVAVCGLRRPEPQLVKCNQSPRVSHHRPWGNWRAIIKLHSGCRSCRSSVPHHKTDGYINWVVHTSIRASMDCHLICEKSNAADGVRPQANGNKAVLEGPREYASLSSSIPPRSGRLYLSNE